MPKPKWSEDDPEYIQYVADRIETILTEIDENRKVPDTKEIERWHRVIYSPVAKDRSVVGRVRQLDRRAPLLGKDVAVGKHPGVTSAAVPQVMGNFSSELKKRVEGLDGQWDQLCDAEQFEQIVALVAWAHGQFVRIHPFHDGNGRMARLLANSLLLRYGIPYNFPIKPRPLGAYGIAAEASMTGDHSRMQEFLAREITLNQII